MSIFLFPSPQHKPYRSVLVCLPVKISSVSLYSRHCLTGILIFQKWHAKSNMLGRVTLQFTKAKRVLKSLVSLEPKFQENPGHPNTTMSYLWAVPLPFCADTEGASWDSPWEVPRNDCTGCEVPRTDLSVPSANDW